VTVRLVGLTGGIATGKSTFAAALRALGVPVLDADQLARRVVEPGTQVLATIAQIFPGVIGPDGRLDRKALGARVFGDETARRRLEAITHPAIRAATAAETARLEAAGEPLVFYDTPLLYEAGLDGGMALVVVVEAPRQAQLRRLAARDGLSPAEAEARLQAQWPIERKVALADVVVENGDETLPLGPKAARLLADLRAGLGRRLPGGAPARY
jgi:dephospho-CoA kinase